MILPGKGFGIETVEEESPAAFAGLQPGMVLTACNGVELVDEATFAQVIAESGGVLELELYDKLEGELLVTTVEMVRIAKSSF